MQPSQLLWRRGNGAVLICVNTTSLDPYTSGVFTRTSTRHTMKWIIACSLSVSTPPRPFRCEAGFIRCAQQCVEWPEALASSWVRQRITCECRGLDDKASGDVSEESGAVWLVLAVEHGFSRRCLCSSPHETGTHLSEQQLVNYVARSTLSP